MKLSKVIKYLDSDASQITPALSSRDVESFVIDSRQVKAGDLFFALSQPDYRNNGFNGEFEDATVYAASALEAGALACVLRRDRFDEHSAALASFSEGLIFTDDVIAALQRLARGVYEDWGRPVIGITGSAGKTTAKELTAHILEVSGLKVLKNIKNYNNGIGHPLTVLELVRDDSYEIAVLEMGMSTPMNEIRRLCRITPPDAAVELNVLPVHIEHLGTLENIRSAKAELVEGLKPGGTAILNADDPNVLSMASLSPGPIITYGLDTAADFTAEDIRLDRFGETRFLLRTPTGSVDVEFPLNGRHSILNALAAAAAVSVFNITPDTIARALATVPVPEQRGQVVHFRQGFSVINDSYNSNPAALLSMVRTLVEGGSESTRRIVVAGEMLELGPEAAAIHRDTGHSVADLGVDVLIGIRGHAEELIQGAKEAGLSDTAFFADSGAAGDYLCEFVRPGDVVLIKGSRGVRTEQVLEKLTDRFETENKEKDRAAA